VLFYNPGVECTAIQPIQLKTWLNQPNTPSQPDNPRSHPGPGGFLFQFPRRAGAASGEREPAARRCSEGPIQRATKVRARESRTTREPQRCVLRLGRLVDRAAARRSRIRTRGSGAAARRSGADRRQFLNPCSELKLASRRGGIAASKAARFDRKARACGSPKLCDPIGNSELSPSNPRQIAEACSASCKRSTPLGCGGYSLLASSDVASLGQSTSELSARGRRGVRRAGAARPKQTLASCDS
jgi:hypothetical protein